MGDGPCVVYNDQRFDLNLQGRSEMLCGGRAAVKVK